MLRGEPDRDAAKRRIRGHAVLGRHGALVPEIVHANLDRKTRRQLGFFTVVERKFSGRRFDKARDARAAARQLGAALVRIRSVKARTVGWPGEFRRPWKRGHPLPRKSAKWLAAYRQQHGIAADPVERWLASRPEQAFRHRPRLTIGSLWPTNLLLTRDRVAFFDLNGVRYASAPMELAQVEFFLGESAHAAFREGYQEHADAGLLDELKRSRDLCRGLFHLRQATRNTSEERRRTHRDLLLRECS